MPTIPLSVSSSWPFSGQRLIQSFCAAALSRPSMPDCYLASLVPTGSVRGCIHVIGTDYSYDIAWAHLAPPSSICSPGPPPMFSVTTGRPAAAPPAAPSPGSLGHRRLHKSSRLQSTGRGLNPDATPAFPGYRGPGPPGSSAARAARAIPPGPESWSRHPATGPCRSRSSPPSPPLRHAPSALSPDSEARDRLRAAPPPRLPSDTVTQGSSPGTDSGPSPRRYCSSPRSRSAGCPTRHLPAHGAHGPPRRLHRPARRGPSKNHARAPSLGAAT